MHSQSQARTKFQAENAATPSFEISIFSERLQFIDLKPQPESFLDAVLEGLSATPKALEPKFFYDENGSRLFERICAQPEYYPTRTEIAILERHVGAMRAAIGEQALLVEFGSGSSRKIRCLLDHLQPAAYIAIDISREQLLEACDELASLYPSLPITAVCADYSQAFHWDAVQEMNAARKIAFFPGSTIGNFTPDDAQAFLAQVRHLVGEDGGMLIGVDMKKDEARLHAAYNDHAGVTAEFNLNLLHRINRELDADFDVSQFQHHAFYNAPQGRIEMHLRSRCAQRVRIGNRIISFASGETIHTENSYKYSRAGFAALAARAGFRVEEVWQDEEQLFGVFYLNAA